MKLNKKGFTLVELLAVIVILALLMVVAFNVVPNIQNDARETAMETEARKLQNQLVEDYNLYLINGSGTYNFGGGDISDDLTDPIELTDGNYKMYAKFDGSKVTDYCITDTKTNGAMAFATNASGATTTTTGSKGCSSTSLGT